MEESIPLSLGVLIEGVDDNEYAREFSNCGAKLSKSGFERRAGMLLAVFCVQNVNSGGQGSLENKLTPQPC
jgi:hypothetical protein